MRPCRKGALNTQMYLLSLDTAAKTAAVAVSSVDEDGVCKPLVRAAVNATLTHSESLLPMVDFCLKNAALSFDDIEVLAVSVGPGSFTGVRIGASTAKGLAFARQGLVCIGVSTLTALAYNVSAYPPDRILLPVMDARRNQFYHAYFKAADGTVERLSEDALLTYEEIAAEAAAHFPGKKLVLVGDGAEAFASLHRKKGTEGFEVCLCEQADMYEDAFSVARYAAHIWKNEAREHPERFDARQLEPVYLRASQAERERAEKEKKE